MTSQRELVLVTALVATLLTLTGCAGGSGRGYPPPSQCPQPRFTGRAPAAIYNQVNPLPPSADNLAAGRDLFEDDAEPACATCHGADGDGRGMLAGQFDPPPRNFSCTETVNGISDGQLYWIVRNGSPGTSMPAFPHLSRNEVWQLVLHLRQLSR